LARTFHDMLTEHGIANKILAFNGDNATSNDKQTRHLHRLPNAFEEVNRVRCFNHTMQLSAKALLRPFDATILPVEGDDMENDVLSEGPDDVDVETGFEDSDDESNNGQADGEETESEDNDGNGSDPLDELDEEEQEELLQNTAAVSTALNKVCRDPPSRSWC
ncbi:hypothetical protein BC826DRAFT_923056, partial [Russula brevipes]